MTTSFAPIASTAPTGASHASPRLRSMLEQPIAPTLLRMSWPNLLMMLAQSGTGLYEMWLLARLGTPVLAGVGVVIPALMLMQNMSQGAMGGGISAAVSRALGAGNQSLADSLARHALVLNAAIGIVFAALLLAVSDVLFKWMGAEGESLAAARTYGHVIFAGLPLLWTMNALASVIRGTGNMVVPGAVICGGAVLLMPVAAALIFGAGPVPALGIAGGAYALMAYYGVGTLVLAWYCMSGRNAARLRGGPLHWLPVRSILVVGALACLNPLLTNGLIAITTAIVGTQLGTQALAGYATAARLEYLLMPIAFGLGAPMVAMVGANLGAGKPERARRIALIGGAMAFVLAEMVGIAAAIWPELWLRQFGADEQMLQIGSQYLRIVGPSFGFFALGFSLYFASQGAQRLRVPLLAGALRVLIFSGIGGALLMLTDSMPLFFAFGALAMFAYGVWIFLSVKSWRWP